MYRPFAHHRSVVDVYDILSYRNNTYDNCSWRCSISSSYPISGFFEFNSFLDFFDFISYLYFRYPDTLLTIYFKSSIL